MFPVILSEIAGGPKLFSQGLNRMACMRRVRPDNGALLHWKVRTVIAFCARLRTTGPTERGQDPRASFGWSVNGAPGRQKATDGHLMQMAVNWR